MNKYYKYNHPRLSKLNKQIRVHAFIIIYELQYRASFKNNVSDINN